jgi:hypothetical protein
MNKFIALLICSGLTFLLAMFAKADSATWLRQTPAVVGN